MKCSLCDKEIEHPMIIKEINVEPQLFIGKGFCNDVHISEYIKKNVKPESIKSKFIQYKTEKNV